MGAYFGLSYNNSYEQLIDESDYNSYMSTYKSKCEPALEKCTSLTGSNSACVSAQTTCYNDIEGPLAESGDFNVCP